MSIQPNPSGGAVERQQGGSLADVVGTILDKGIVVDVFARVSLVGIELLRVDVRVVIASVDTYLRFADAANRLEMGSKEPSDLAGVLSQVTGSGSGGQQQEGQDQQQGQDQDQGQPEGEEEGQQPALESGDQGSELDQGSRLGDRGVQRDRQPARREQQEGRR